ncbi:MAG: putative membrane protein YedE/YeeE [Paracoccaceae bacterium]|jgi:uncharacterized membrane protein YedE/YeeE
MFEELGFDGWTPLQAAVVFGLGIGVLFGALAQRSRFCLRRGLVGEDAGDRARALALWVVALAVATLGVQGAAALGLIDLGETRFVTETVALVPILAGGLMFGAGMVLSRGCASRLTVLAASGNMRAAACVVVFAIAAHATMKGALNFIPQALSGGDWTPTAPALDAALGVSPWLIAGALAVLAVVLAVRSGARIGTLAMGAAIGALIPLAWVGTGLVLADEFDPIAFESLAFTRPAAEALFWAIAGTAIPAGFGVGFMGGVLAGAHLAARAARELSFASFASAPQTARYISGAALMGVGGVMAGGCTVGAGLAGVPTLGLSAIAALAAIAAGALATHGALRTLGRGTNMAAIPAE